MIPVIIILFCGWAATGTLAIGMKSGQSIFEPKHIIIILVSLLIGPLSFLIDYDSFEERLGIK